MPALLRCAPHTPVKKTHQLGASLLQTQTICLGEENRQPGRVAEHSRMRNDQRGLLSTAVMQMPRLAQFWGEVRRMAFFIPEWSTCCYPRPHTLGISNLSMTFKGAPAPAREVSFIQKAPRCHTPLPFLTPFL